MIIKYFPPMDRMRDLTMKKFFHKLWDKAADHDLRLPLMVVVLFLTLVLAGLVVTSRLLERPPDQGAGVLLLSGEFQQTTLPEEQTALEQTAPEEIPAPAAEAPRAENAEIILIPSALTEETKTGWTRLNGNEYYLKADGSPMVGLQRIGRRLYYFDENGVRAGSLGIDVSYYDSSIDWQLVKAQGIDFAIIRVGGRGWTSGALYGDCRTQEYLRRARAAGVKIGVYFYSTAINPAEAVEEAEASLKAVGGIPLDFPIFIDMEFSGEYPKGRADRLSPSERAEIALAFCETVRASGYEAGVYASQNYLKASIDYYVISRYTVWLASYTRDNRLPFFDKRYDIWQFSDSGRVDGIGGAADMNVIF